MLSEFNNVNVFEKPISLSINVPARFHAFCFSCNSYRNETSFDGSWMKQRHRKSSGSLTYGIDTV